MCIIVILEFKTILLNMTFVASVYWKQFLNYFLPNGTITAFLEQLLGSPDNSAALKKLQQYQTKP